MGDLLGSPRIAPLFLGLTGTIPVCHLSSRWVSPFLSPSEPGDLQSEQQIVRYRRASKIFPRFLPQRRSDRLRTIDGNDNLFGRSRRKLWVETLGGGWSNRDGGDGSLRGSVRTCFMRR